MPKVKTSIKSIPHAGLIKIEKKAPVTAAAKGIKEITVILVL